MHVNGFIEIQGKKPHNKPQLLTFHVVLVFHRNPKRPFMYTFSPLHIKDKFQLFG